MLYIRIVDRAFVARGCDDDLGDVILTSSGYSMVNKVHRFCYIANHRDSTRSYTRGIHPVLLSI